MLGALFIDGPNVIHSLLRGKDETERVRIDYYALPLVLSRLLSEPGAAPNSPGHLRFGHKAYYGGFRHERDKMRLKEFNRMLANMGYVVHESRTRECRRWRSCPTCKQDVPEGHVFFLDKETDLSIGLDAYSLAVGGQVDLVAVVTNDGDFAALFKRLRSLKPSRKAVGVVVGWKAEMSMDLKMSAERVVFLDEVLGDIVYRL